MKHCSCRCTSLCRGCLLPSRLEGEQSSFMGEAFYLGFSVLPGATRQSWSAESRSRTHLFLYKQASIDIPKEAKYVFICTFYPPLP